MKTIIIILVLGLLIPYLGFLIVHLNNWTKAYVKIKWWTTMYLLGIFGLTEYVMFFPAWWTRKIPFLNKVFWIWLDDERYVEESSVILFFKYSTDYYEHLEGKKETIWTAYSWHTRNKVWNLDSLFRPSSGFAPHIEEIVKDNLIMNLTKVDQGSYWVPMARLKYWKNGAQGSQVNNGDAISLKYSIFGVGYLWETRGKVLTFRYSFLVPVWKFYINFVSGYNGKRNVFTIKIKRQIEIR